MLIMFVIAVLTKPQRIIFDEVKAFVLSRRKPQSGEEVPTELTMPNTFPARERRFITTLATDLNLDIFWDEYDDEDQNLVVLRLPDTHDGAAEDGGDDEGPWEDVDSEEDAEAQEAVDRVLNKYEKAKVVEDEEEDFDVRHERAVQEKMDEWKRNYYRVGWFALPDALIADSTLLQEKLEISYDNPEQMHQLAYRYVEGLQWVMHYYYSGVASWSWFYNYHYAPRISGTLFLSLCCIAFLTLGVRKDLKNVDKMSFKFDLARPFRPFEQLMGVLPEASKEHIPLAFQVSGATSSILL